MGMGWRRGCWRRGENVIVLWRVFHLMIYVNVVRRTSNVAIMSERRRRLSERSERSLFRKRRRATRLYVVVLVSTRDLCGHVSTSVSVSLPSVLVSNTAPLRSTAPAKNLQNRMLNMLPKHRRRYININLRHPRFQRINSPSGQLRNL